MLNFPIGSCMQTFENVKLRFICVSVGSDLDSWDNFRISQGFQKKIIEKKLAYWIYKKIKIIKDFSYLNMQWKIELINKKRWHPCYNWWLFTNQSQEGKKSTVLILLNHIFPNKQDASLTFKNYSKLHIKKYCELFLKF